MQEKKSLILTVLLILIVISITIVNINLYKKVRNKSKYLEEQLDLKKQIQNITDEYYNNSTLKEISNVTTFHKVRLCTETYFSTLHYLWYNDELENDSISQENIDNIDFTLSSSVSLKLLNVLGKNYKSEMNITEETLEEKYNMYFRQDTTIINKVYQYDINEGITMFLVKGNNFCNDGSNKEAFKIMVITDNKNNTFEVYPEEYIEKYGINETKLNSKISELDNITKIEKNNYNKIPNEIMTNEKLAQYYFDLYKFNIKYDVEYAYDMLNEEYKEKKFGSVENYKKYIDTYYDDLITTMDKYQVTINEDYKQYLCIDKNGFYYIFQIKNCLDYNLILDTYTVDLPEFIEKYYGIEPTNKVALNIQKVFDAMNDKDYKYIYGKLSDGFKQNYFETLESFEEYIEENFYEKNEVEYLFYQKESEEYYSYTIKVSNEEDRDEYKTLKIIMKLKETTQFEFSFNVD